MKERTPEQELIFKENKVLIYKGDRDRIARVLSLTDPLDSPRTYKRLLSALERAERELERYKQDVIEYAASLCDK